MKPIIPQPVVTAPPQDEAPAPIASAQVPPPALPAINPGVRLPYIEAGFQYLLDPCLERWQDVVAALGPEVGLRKLKGDAVAEFAKSVLVEIAKQWKKEFDSGLVGNWA